MSGTRSCADGLTKRYGADRGVIDLDVQRRRGRGVRLPRPERRRQDDDDPADARPRPPDVGHASRVLGLDPRRDGSQLRRRLGVVPGDLRLYERLTGREHRALLRVAPRTARPWPTVDDARRAPRARPRPARARSLEGEPAEDRPDPGADAPARAARPRRADLGARPARAAGGATTLVREATADGRTVFLSSHVLSEVQRIADRVAIIREGRLELVEGVESLRAERSAASWSRSRRRHPRTPSTALPGVTETRAARRRSSRLALEGPADPLVKALARFDVVALDSHEADLEDVFLALYRGSGRWRSVFAQDPARPAARPRVVGARARRVSSR